MAEQPTLVQAVQPAPVVEQPTLVQAVQPATVVKQPKQAERIPKGIESTRYRLSTGRALGVIGAVLVTLSPLLPWLSVRFARSHSGFNIAWSDLIPGRPFPGGRPTLPSVGLVVLLLGIVALWWALTDRPSWLGLIVGGGVFVIATGVAVQVARTIGDDLVRFFDIVDIGVFAAAIGSVLVVLGWPSKRH